IWASHAKRFHTHLVKLAITASLRTLMAEHRACVPQPLHLVVKQTMLFCSSHTTDCTFRAQGERITVAIFKGIHLFFNNIRHFTKSTAEQVCLLLNGCADFAVTIAR